MNILGWCHDKLLKKSEISNLLTAFLCQLMLSVCSLVHALSHISRASSLYLYISRHGWPSENFLADVYCYIILLQTYFKLVHISVLFSIRKISLRLGRGQVVSVLNLVLHQSKVESRWSLQQFLFLKLLEKNEINEKVARNGPLTKLNSHVNAFSYQIQISLLNYGRISFRVDVPKPIWLSKYCKSSFNTGRLPM